MLGLMESALHHFFDDLTDAATLDALMRGRLVRRSTQKPRVVITPATNCCRFEGTSSRGEDYAE
jgi:hypothetical protein